MLNRHKHTTRPYAPALTALGLVTSLLLSSPWSAVAASQTPTGRGTAPSQLERVFGVPQQELLVHRDARALLASPVEEDQHTDGPGSATRSSLRPDIHGVSSVENFQGTQNNLSNTHESAGGFRQFLEKWYASNFHRQDTGVSTWLFHDYNASGRNFDLWPSGGIDLGIDAVRAAFHSSHGGMSSNVFFTSMGNNWSSTGWNAFSNLMALGGNHNGFGDERLRYMFWDTCNSVMISGGNNPYSTWGTRAKGIRFVFGYETVSIDSPNYGKYFWEEWAKGKTFKSAFLDASWRINTGQAPALVAFGASQSEAVSRRDTERMLYAGAVGNNWGAWSWYSARSMARRSAADVLASVTTAPTVAVKQRSNTAQDVLAIADAVGLSLPDTSAILDGQAQLKVVQTSALTLAVEPNGNFELFRTAPMDDDRAATTVLSDAEVLERARRIARQVRVLTGQPLRVSMIRDLNDNVGTDGQQGKAQVSEKTVIFDQVVHGLPFIDAEAGHLEIGFHARSGQVTRVRNTLQALQPAQRSQSAPVMSLDAARQEAVAAFQQATSADSRVAAAAVNTIADSEAVGYQMIDGQAVLVYRAHLTSDDLPGMRPFQAIIPLVK